MHAPGLPGNAAVRRQFGKHQLRHAGVIDPTCRERKRNKTIAAACGVHAGRAAGYLSVNQDSRMMKMTEADTQLLL
jgi:ribosomal protein L32